MSKGFNLDDYVTVEERISVFREKHPEGSLQAEVLRWPEEGFGFVAVKAWAYRSPEDPRPGEGLAWEQFPGKTPYTNGSELQNAETSAWGRAIVAVLAADTKKGIASAQEVRRGQTSGADAVVKDGGAEATGSRSPGDAVPTGTTEPTGTQQPVVAPESSDQTTLAHGEGVNGSDSETAGEGGGETPSSPATPTWRERAIEQYGSYVNVLKEAKQRYGPHITKLIDLSEEQFESLVTGGAK